MTGTFTVQDAIDQLHHMAWGTGYFQSAAYAFMMVLNFRGLKTEDRPSDFALNDRLWEDGLEAMTRATNQNTPVRKDDADMDPLEMMARFQALPYGPGQYLRPAYGLWCALALFHRAREAFAIHQGEDALPMITVYMTYARSLVNQGALAMVAARGEEDAA